MERSRGKEPTPADRQRFRKVHQALELREEKKRTKEALREVDEWLKSNPQSLLGRAAKALVLDQVPGRAGEAAALARAVLAEGPVDDGTVNCLALVLKAAGPAALAELTRYLETRAAAAPDDQPLQEQLLFALARDAPPARAAAHAVAMHTRFPGDRSFFLMVACAFAAYSADPAANALQLRLAEAWLSKAAAAGRISTPEQLQLQLQVLRAAGRLDAARTAAASAPPACWAHSRDRLRALHELAIAAGDQAAQLEQARALVALDPSDLAHWLALADAVPPAEAVSAVQPLVDAAVASKSGDSRAPLLAGLQVRVRAGAGTGTAEALAAYWAAHGARMAARFDVAPLLLSGGPLAGLLASLPNLPAGGGGRPEDAQAQAAANCAYLALAAGAAPSLLPLLPASALPQPPAEAPAQGAESSECVRLSAQLAAAGHVLLARYCASGCVARDALVAGAALLEAARAFVPTDPAVRFALLALYLHAGAVAPAAALLRELDVKSVQLDSLAFVVLRPLLALPHASAAVEHMAALAKLAREGPRDMSDLVSLPLRHGAFSKMTEFSAFRTRVAQSLVLNAFPLLSLLHALAAAPASGPAAALLAREQTLLSGLPWTAAHVAQLRNNDDPHVRSFVSPVPAHARLLAPDWDRQALRAASFAPPVLAALCAAAGAIDTAAPKALAAALEADPELLKGQRTARVLHLIARVAQEPAADASAALYEALAAELAGWAAPLFGREVAAYGAPAPPPAGPTVSALAEARRSAGEEVAWTLLAVQALAPLVPRKAKAARAALRKLHTTISAQLSTAATAVQQALASSSSAAVAPPADVAGVFGDAVLQAVWKRTQDELAGSWRASLTLLHKMLTSYGQLAAAVSM